MIIEGKYGQAKVFANIIEDEAIEQIKRLLDQEFIQGAKIRIMPDVHQGMGCVIGFTADLGEKVIPNIVGVDIGCGILTVKLGKIDIDLRDLDEIIRNRIPVGYKVQEQRLVKYPRLKELHLYRELKDTRRLERSIGSLGSGNHFIELALDSKGEVYLLIHSGSRNLGHQLASLYQDLAIDLRSGKEPYYKRREELIKEYSDKKAKKKLKKALKELEEKYKDLQADCPKDLAYLTGKYRENYLDDMKIAQEYASLNRKTMANLILKDLLGKEVDDFNYFETVHNYIDFRDNIVRKGAISAREGEMLLIPLNMKDGSILARGLGNEDWNMSAPHGAGRLLSRRQARQIVDLEEFKEEMKGIYTTTINQSTIDEAPFVYKSLDDILPWLEESVEIIDRLRPIYNFKG